MPPYDFNFDIRALLDEYIKKNAGQSLRNQQQQTPSGTDIANQAFAAATQQKNQEFAERQAQQQAIQQAQAQQQQSFIDPVARRAYLPQVMAAKALYEGNPNNPALQEQAAKSADIWRKAAQDADFDLSQYGSGVSLEDAYRNLQTNDARAAVDFAQGKYALNSDEYFKRKYRELMEQGYSARHARRAAGELAQRYQGERVVYLDKMLHGYGFDGRVMTPLGQQIAGQIALEGQPEIASMYLSQNPNQNAAYQQENALAQQVMQDKGAMVRLMQNYVNNLNTMQAQADINRVGKYEDEKIRQRGKMFDKDVDFAYSLKAAAQAQKMDDEQFNTKLNRLMNITSSVLKLSPEDQKFAIASAFNLNIPTGKNDLKQAVIDKIQKQKDSLLKEQELIIKQLTGDQMLPDDLREYYLQRMKYVDENLNAVDSVLGEAFGITPDFSLPDKIAGDLETGESDMKLIRKMIEVGNSTGIDRKETAKRIEQYFKEHGATDEYARMAFNLAAIP